MPWESLGLGQHSTSTGAWKPIFAGLAAQCEMEALSHLGRCRCCAGDTQEGHYSPLTQGIGC